MKVKFARTITLAMSVADVIKKPCSTLIKLHSLDEVAVLDGTRPQHQVADSSKLGRGGAIYLISADFQKLNVIGQYSGCLDDAQALWHPLSQELNAQL